MISGPVSDAFIEVADTLGDDFDTSAFLRMLTRRSVELMPISAAGVLLADDRSKLDRCAASSREAYLLQRFQLQTGQGPGVDCFRTGDSVSAEGLAADDRWPDFALGAVDAGFAAVHTVAMRHRTKTIGALSFFTARTGPLGQGALNTGRALGEIAAIGLLQRDRIRSRETRADQLQTALDSRVLIEQAKGILAERLGLSVSDAFSLLRRYARSHNRRLLDVAHGVVNAAEQLGPATISQLASPRAADDTSRPSGGSTHPTPPD